MNIEIVPASAGTGKTHHIGTVLSERLAAGTVRPEAIVATTFTNKAADDLAERLRVRLIQAGRVADAQRLAAARIGTVNAVCGRLVSDFAFDLGLSPTLTVLDEAQATAALREAGEEVRTEAESSELADICSRVRQQGRGFGTPEPYDWQAELDRLLQAARANNLSAADLASSAKRSWAGLQNWLPAALGEGPVREYRSELVANLGRFLAESADNGDTTGATTTYRRTAERVASDLRQDRWPAWSELRALGHNGVGAGSRGVAGPLQTLASRHLELPAFQDDLRRLIELLFSLAARALTAYQQHKAERGVLDFTDQEVHALRALSLPTVAERLRGQIDLVVVDEFQDTSPIQLAVFLKLAELAKESLWVGDPKQSIYGFRDADPDLMQQCVAAILQGAAPQTVLGQSYRSPAALVDPTSDVLEPAFAARGVPPEQVRVSSALSHRPDDGVAFEYWPLPVPGNRVNQRLPLIAAGVHALVAEGLKVRRADGSSTAADYSDIAILTSTNRACRDLAEALEVAGVPATVEQPGLLARPEARLVYAGLRLWADRDDALARAELARLTTPGDQAQTWLDAAAEPEDDGEESERRRPFEAAAVVQAVLAARTAADHAGPLVAFDRVVQATDARDWCCRWGDASARLANLEALRQAVAEAVAADAALELPSAILHLDELAQKQTDRQAEGVDAVTISTFHGSKGLEWPIVVIDQRREGRGTALGQHVVSEAKRLDLAAPLAGRWVRFWPCPYPSNTQTSCFHDRLRETAEEAAAADRAEYENLRLAYVAWTRARDRLVVAALPGDLGTQLLRGLELPQPEAGATTWLSGAPVRIRALRPAEAVGSIRSPGSCHVPPADRPQHPPLVADPSAEHGAGQAGEPLRLGERLALRGDPDMVLVGQAVHDFLAADDPALALDERAALAAGLLARWQVPGALDPAEVVGAADTLARWVDATWPGARQLREVRLSHRLASGTEVRGSADLLLDTPAGWVLVDHKTFPGRVDEALTRAAGYAGQLAAYAAAVEAATGRPVAARYVHLPVLGLVVPVDGA